MMYILQSSKSHVYSLYCDELKLRTYADECSLEHATKRLLAGNAGMANTLQLAIEQYIYNNDQTPLVYSKADYPELFI